LTLCSSLARQKARSDQHARIGGVGAGGDRGDHHVAVAEILLAALDREARIVIRRLLVFDGERIVEQAGNRRQRDAAFRTLRTCERGHNVAEIERQQLGEHRIGRLGGAEQALRLGILFNERDARRCPRS
jgi:hypothetical protein